MISSIEKDELDLYSLHIVKFVVIFMEGTSASIYVSIVLHVSKFALQILCAHIYSSMSNLYIYIYIYILYLEHNAQTPYWSNFQVSCSYINISQKTISHKHEPYVVFLLTCMYFCLNTYYLYKF